ncbi:MAG: phage protein [Microgenomates group bacterium Gr01-1014_7]|nr:MAG: phage protein [Microgenomates group bacterium Gr01-1014_7]
MKGFFNILKLKEITLLKHLKALLDAPEVRRMNGKKWVVKTYSQWAQCLPEWNLWTIRRTIYKLEAKNIILSHSFNKKIYDFTKWYRLSKKGEELLK